MGFNSIGAGKLLARKPTKLKGSGPIYRRNDFAEERRRALGVWAENLV